ncbi:hypothetical protein ACFQV2_12760 [Actinokineospora soli]|uniref:Uncharacterized protein n=1 Tax=Actinokineospora soli TaxID=1048753 RepID=A0ABW2TL70_9PSEU
MTARGQALGAWAHLVTALRVAENRLAQPSWYDAANALNDLMEVYVTSRAVRVHRAHDDEVGTFVFPRSSPPSPGARDCFTTSTTPSPTIPDSPGTPMPPASGTPFAAARSPHRRRCREKP